MVAKPLCPLYKNIIKPLDRARYPELRYIEKVFLFYCYICHTDTFFILYPRLKESQPKRCPFVPETLGAFDRMFRAFVLVVRGTYPRCMGDMSSMYRASTYDI